MTNVRPASLDGSANILLELAGLLQAGRPEPHFASWVAAPAAHEEVANRTKDFAGFAQDQYQDVVALLTALSTKLKVASDQYVRVDAAAQQKMNSFLTNSTFRPA